MINLFHKKYVYYFMVFVIMTFANFAKSGNSAGADLKGQIATLESFGPVGNVSQAEQTLKKAIKDIQKKGVGIIFITSSAPNGWVPACGGGGTNKTSKAGDKSTADKKVSVTIVDIRKGFISVILPATENPRQGSLNISQTLRNPAGFSPGYEGKMISIQNNIISGPLSYLQPATEKAEAGNDVKIYVNNIIGLKKGVMLNIHSGSGYKGNSCQVMVKDIGYDEGKKKNYIVADLKQRINGPTDELHGGYLDNKNSCGSMKIEVNANCNENTRDFQITRRQYANGDAALVDAKYFYQANNHSGLGDENGVVINAESAPDYRCFSGTVKSINRKSHVITFEKGDSYKNAFALGTGRPLINMNSKKWITKGYIHVVRPPDWHDPKKIPVDPEKLRKCTYRHRNYPSRIGRGGKSGLILGGLMFTTKGVPWTADIVGRFIAINEPTERIEPVEKQWTGGSRGKKTQETTYRWYEITDFRIENDKQKFICVRRTFCWDNPAGAPQLINEKNYTCESNHKRLKYIIAPGAYVSDVSQAWENLNPDQRVPSKRTVQIIPNSITGTKFDFESGDKVVQAIGADPIIPTALRIRQSPMLPGLRPSESLAIKNLGKVAIDKGIVFKGLPRTKEELAKRKDNRPAFESALDLQCMVGVGINVPHNVGDAVIMMHQPDDKPQPLVWKHKGLTRKTELFASPLDGALSVVGGGLKIEGGISSSAVPAYNLCGKNIAIRRGYKYIEIKFPVAEKDTDYAATVELNWISPKAITNKTVSGFTVIFEKPAPEKAKLDWMIVR